MSAYRRLKFDQSLWSTLRDSHAGVRAVFLGTSDQDNYGMAEHWGRPVPDAHGYLRGDCDDFAIECDHRAREAGLADLLPLSQDILDGKIRGRLVVNVNA